MHRMLLEAAELHWAASPSVVQAVLDVNSLTYRQQGCQRCAASAANGV
jgi:hypothetical protein